MQTNEILSASLIDIIFDGRNKDYGAYELRKNYSGRIGRATLVMSLIVAFAFGGVIMASSNKKTRGSYVIGPERVLESIKEKPQEKIPEPDRPKPPEQEIKTEKFPVPIIKPDEQVTTPPTAIADLDSAMIGLEKKGGVLDSGIQKPPIVNVDGGKGIIDLPKAPEGPVENVDVDAKFTGNWKAFLERNLNAEVPVDNGAPSGTYSVVIQFVVDLDGTISEIKALTAQGYGMEQEALRVIRKASKWEPGIYHGFPVKSYRKQVITFQVVEG